MSPINLNKIVLGTVQLGTNYGITNKKGQFSKKEAFELLSYSWDLGIRHFDTAPGYKSEKIIGEFIKSHGLSEEVVISTKIPSLQNDKHPIQGAITSIENSLNNLNSSLNFVFLHEEKDSGFLDLSSKELKNIQDSYSINRFGVSVYEPKTIHNFDTTSLDLCFQFPFNFLDRRFEKVDKKKDLFFARSIFLQGILANGNYINPDSSEELKELHYNFHKLIKQNSLNPISLCFSFVLNEPKIDFIVLGVESLKNLKEIVEAEVYNPNEINKISLSKLNFNPLILDPRAW